MKRRQLFQFGELPWLPDFLRESITDSLAMVCARTQLPAFWESLALETLRAAGTAAIVDLGSGGPGRAVLHQLRQSAQPVTVILTALSPGATESEGNMRYWPHAVDAGSVPWSLKGLRTMFASFHRFEPEDARRILADACWCDEPICIVEGSPRRPAAIVSSFLILMPALLLTPAVRPMKLRRLVFTYAIPLLPLLILWDGLVSHLRTYSADEMLAMARECGRGGYEWRAGEIHVPGCGAGMPYLIGRPARTTSLSEARREVHGSDQPVKSWVGSEGIDEGVDVEYVREDCAIFD